MAAGSDPSATIQPLLLAARETQGRCRTNKIQVTPVKSDVKSAKSALLLSPRITPIVAARDSTNARNARRRIGLDCRGCRRNQRIESKSSTSSNPTMIAVRVLTIIDASCWNYLDRRLPPWAGAGCKSGVQRTRHIKTEARGGGSCASDCGIKLLRGVVNPGPFAFE